MSLKFELYISNTLDPFENLAIEQDLLMGLEDDVCKIFLWRGSKSVIMGRFQNPWLETNIPYNLGNGIQTVRRQSGGGTIYCDPENLNYCFLHPTRDFNKDLNHKIIIDVLAASGFDVFTSGRSDLLINHDESVYKISGSAFKQKRDRSFHHGTLLFNSNKEELSKSLKTPHTVTNSKSIASNPHPVINLCEIDQAYSQEQFIKDLEERCDTGNPTIINFKEKHHKYRNELKDWQWLVGETPYFEITSNGVGYTVKKGVNLDSGDKVKLDSF